MNYSDLLGYLRAKPAVEESFPFYPDIPVFKVKDKVFAIVSKKEGIEQVNLKCDPDWSEALRMCFTSVKPGYHMNKRHWNTVLLDGDVPDFEIERMVDHSFALVVKGLKKSQRSDLELNFEASLLYGRLQGDS
jgi:predicted DNA-binding protein (MmcQ/YjbR family)